MDDHTYSSTHPLLPPTTEEDRLAWLRLLRSRRVGVSTFYRLMGEYGTAQDALDALPEVARSAGVTEYEACPLQIAEQEMERAQRCNARMICRGSASYPALLAETPDAPPFFWMRGNIDALRRPMVAMVGARNASSLGARMARALASDLSEAGYIIVSGLARGIDSCAHQAAVEGGTLAVLAGGADVLYPAENTQLAERLMDQGALISEQPFGMAPVARHFPMRNRIISGLCAATLVVEAAAKSGSLITARNALDQGRDVLAVPGHPFDARAAGCNMLIRDGASLIRSAADVAEHLPAIAEPEGTQAKAGEVRTQSQMSLEPPHETKRAKPALRAIAGLHQRILDRLGPSPVAEDQLLRDIGMSSREVTPALTEMEMKGRIKRNPGGLLSRL